MKKHSFIKLSLVLLGGLSLVGTISAININNIKEAEAETFTAIPADGSLVNSGKYLKSLAVVQTEYSLTEDRPEDIIARYFNQTDKECRNRMITHLDSFIFYLNYSNGLGNPNDFLQLFHTGTDDRSKAVTDLFAVYVDTPSGDTHQPEHTITRKVNGYNVTYEAVPCFNYTDLDNPVFYPEVDLNAGAGGWTITLYYTTDPHAGMPIKDVRGFCEYYKKLSQSEEAEYPEWEKVKSRIWWQPDDPTNPDYEMILDYDMGVEHKSIENTIILKRYDDDFINTKVLFDDNEIGSINHGGYIVPSEVTVNSVFEGYDSTNSEVVLFSSTDFTDANRITDQSVIYQDNVYAVIRSKSTAPEEEIEFLYNTYMHFGGEGSYSQSESGSGDCISKGWYNKVKSVINYVISADTWDYYKNGSGTNIACYNNVVERLKAWAIANGEEFVIDSINNQVSFVANAVSTVNIFADIQSNQNNLIVIIAILIIIPTALLFVLKKKKVNHK